MDRYRTYLKKVDLNLLYKYNPINITYEKIKFVDDDSIDKNNFIYDINDETEYSFTLGIINYSEGKMEQEILKLLIDGPKDEGVYPTINPNTTINSITIKDGLCTIDFSDDFLNQTCNVSSDVAIYSVVNTMCSLDNISRVKISVNGSSSHVYQEKFNLEDIYERNQSLVIQ